MLALLNGNKFNVLHVTSRQTQWVDGCCLYGPRSEEQIHTLRRWQVRWHSHWFVNRWCNLCAWVWKYISNDKVAMFVVLTCWSVNRHHHHHQNLKKRVCQHVSLFVCLFVCLSVSRQAPPEVHKDYIQRQNI